MIVYQKPLKTFKDQVEGNKITEEISKSFTATFKIKPNKS